MKRTILTAVVSFFIATPVGFVGHAMLVHHVAKPVVLAAATPKIVAGPAAMPNLPAPIVMHDTQSIPAEALQDWGAQKQPIGLPVSRISGQEYLHGAFGKMRSGVWQCSPGRWRRQIMDAELAHFVSGHAIFTPDGGAPIEIRAGDTVWFPPDSTGIWDILEPTRKTFMTTPAPGLSLHVLAMLDWLLR